MSAAGQTGRVYLLDLRRVWWLYLIPKRDGFYDSIRTAHLPQEVADMFGALGRRLAVKATFPFLPEVLVHPQPRDS